MMHAYHYSVPLRTEDIVSCEADQDGLCLTLQHKGESQETHADFNPEVRPKTSDSLVEEHTEKAEISLGQVYPEIEQQVDEAVESGDAMSDQEKAELIGKEREGEHEGKNVENEVFYYYN